MTRAGTRSGLALLLWTALSVCNACHGCGGCGETPLAELLSAEGEVERDFAAKMLTWSAAEVGAEFHVDDGLRTGTGSRASARVFGSGKVVLAPGSAIRFRTGKRPGEDPAQLDLTEGEAVLEAGDTPLSFGTAMGHAVLEAGGRIRITPGEDGTRYRVELGQADFEGDDGKRIEVTAGHGITVGIGLAQLEEESDTGSEPEAAANTAAALAGGEHAAPSPGDAGSGEAQAPEQGLDEESADEGADEIADEGADEGADDAPAPPERDGLSFEPGLGERDMTVPAGLTFRVYDPRPPTAIAFNVGNKCPRGAAIRIGQRAVVGERQVVVAVDRGTHAYTAHCVNDGALGKIVGRGRVRVLRDTGARQLKTGRAPKSTVDADGRHYTVMYQSNKPTITVRWPRAPKASQYVLYVKSGGAKPQSFKSKQARIVLKSGTLDEGVHKVFFAGQGTGGKRSKETTIQVAFDNAAPTAQITAPPASGFTAGTSVEVAGMAVPGSKVSLLGKALRLDRQHRFKTTVKTSAGQRALAVRFKHARHGVRYYLRRTAGHP